MKLVIDELPPQQKLMVEFVAEGWLNKEIAARMNIAEATVKNTLSAIAHRIHLAGSVGMRIAIIKYFYEFVPRKANAS